tara:strand:- start:9981 stop:10733 length:753 start_codon:yes stop_codon:yes gene_type:complete
MKRIICWLGLALLLMSGGLCAKQETFRFYGYAFDQKGEKYLYTEVHEQNYIDQKWAGGTITYYSPDGAQMGVKTLDFSADPFIPEYDYQLPALDYREGIVKVDRQKVVMSRTVDGKTRTETVKNKAPISGDSGFHNFMVAHFAKLMAGDTVPFTFIAAGNLDTFKFRARRIEDGSFEGKKMVRFKVEANSLLRLVAPDLTVTYDPELKHLKQYEGPSNVINPETEKVYDTRISYYSEPPPGAPDSLPPLE